MHERLPVVEQAHRARARPSPPPCPCRTASDRPAPSADTVTFRRSARSSAGGPVKIVPCKPGSRGSSGCTIACDSSTTRAISIPTRRSSGRCAASIAEAGRFAVHDRVERAAEGHVGPNCGCRRSSLTGSRRAGRTTGRSERDRSTALAAASVSRAPGWFRRACRTRCVLPSPPGIDQPPFERDRGHRDDAVPGHRRVPVVVHEEQAGVRSGRHRLGEHRAAHVACPRGSSISTRRRVVGVPLRPVPLVEHRPAARRRKAVDDEPKRRRRRRAHRWSSASSRAV